MADLLWLVVVVLFAVFIAAGVIVAAVRGRARPDAAVDHSADPRQRTVREIVNPLGAAASVQSTVYGFPTSSSERLRGTGPEAFGTKPSTSLYIDDHPDPFGSGTGTERNS